MLGLIVLGIQIWLARIASRRGWDSLPLMIVCANFCGWLAIYLLVLLVGGAESITPLMPIEGGGNIIIVFYLIYLATRDSNPDQPVHG